MIDIFKLVKPKPFINYLREKYPECKWTYNRKANRYEGSDGSSVWGTAFSSARYDGDDDSYFIRYHRYFNDGRPPELVW